MEANHENGHSTDCIGGGFQELNKGTENPVMIDTVIIESNTSESEGNGRQGGGGVAGIVAKPSCGSAGAAGACSSCAVRTPPPFLIKTYDMVENIETNSIVSWNSTGSSFIVWNAHLFAANILPQYFKHKNFQSFVCQLNMYGFRKINWDQWEFKNEYFQRGKMHLLKHIKRRNQYPQSVRKQKPARTEPNMNSSPRDTEKEIQSLMHDHEQLKVGIQKLKEHQQTLENEFAMFKNVALGNAKKIQKMAMFIPRTFLSKTREPNNDAAKNPLLLVEERSDETAAEPAAAPEFVGPLVSKNGKDIVEETSDIKPIPRQDTAEILMASSQELNSEHFAGMEKLIMDELASDRAQEEEMAEYQRNTFIASEDLMGRSSDWVEYLRALQESNTTQI